MKSITITIPEELDVRAVAEARRRGVSKSELIRVGLDAVLPPRGGPIEGDLWHSLAGFGSAEVNVRPDEIDDIIYGT